MILFQALFEQILNSLIFEDFSDIDYIDLTKMQVGLSERSSNCNNEIFGTNWKLLLKDKISKTFSKLINYVKRHLGVRA